MTTPSATVPMDELLAQASWARRLAYSLVRDEATADDLVQEAYASALVRPPDAGRPLRPWLATVIRNALRMRLRASQRRGAREEAHGIEAPEAAPDAETLLARVEQQRRLAELVVALDEPFRTTLLLRYYEALDAAEIARRLDIPAGTVRWRLKEGLDRLRAQLDARHSGDRRAWQLLLAPLGAPTPTLVQGGLMMKILLALALVGGGVGTAAIVTHRVSPVTAPAATARPTPPPPREVGAQLPRLQPPQREAMLGRIRQLRAARPAAATPTLDKDYIRDEIAGLVPLVEECYEAALVDHPKLSGKIVVRFTITGEPEVGGLIADSHIEDEHSTIRDESLRECIAQTMYAAQFPAPPNGGEIVVSYPFVLETD